MEITSDLMQKIRYQKWARQYFISDPEAKFVDNYGNVILSKVQFHECLIKNLETRMGRKTVVGSFIVKQSPQVVVATFHLESYLEDHIYRAKQLQAIKELTQAGTHVILVGDTNFHLQNEGDILSDKFKDAWAEIFQKTPDEALKNPGLTFDTETNLMLNEEYNSRGMGEKRQRLDRCFYTHDSLEPITMEVLGTKPYLGNNEFVSDHYGIFVKLRFK